MNQRKEQVYRLLHEKISGTITAGENRLAEQLIAEDADTAVLWEQMKQLYQQQGATLVQKIDEDEAWEKLNARLDIAPHSKWIRKAINTPWPLVCMVAASLAVIVFTGYVVFTGFAGHATAVATTRPEEPAETPSATGVQFTTGGGKTYNLAAGSSFTTPEGAVVKTGKDEMSFSIPGGRATGELNTLRVPAMKNYHVVLQDGTEIWLNSASTLWFPYTFGGNTRDVTIEGEALFKVAKDAHHPFIVHTKGSDVRVLGTTFNVNTYENDKVYTSLIEGSVMAYAINDTISLKPGYQSVYHQGKKLQKATFNADEVLGWRKGVYYFHEATLYTVLNMAAKWYGLKVNFDDPHTCQLTFSGAIDKNKPITTLLENLHLSSGLRFALTDGQLRVMDAKKS